VLKNYKKKLKTVVIIMNKHGYISLPAALSACWSLPTKLAFSQGLSLTLVTDERVFK